MQNWQKQLNYDPVSALSSSTDAEIQYFVKRDLLDDQVSPVNSLWQLPGAQKLLRKQQSDGSWDCSASKKKSKDVNYKLIETWKHLRFLVACYGFNRQDERIRNTAEYIFSCQTEEGDIRGFLANQYATYYTGALLALLIDAGYGNDPRVAKGFTWLLSMRQDDKGWSIPIITHKFDRETMYRLTSQYAEPVEADRSKPFSHNWTGMVLRVFAAHPKKRKLKAAKTAAALLKSRFFQPDCYTSYQAASYWVRFDYPFWWNNLVAALDSISLIDPSMDEHMDKALNWLVKHQQADGLWNTSYVNDKKTSQAKTDTTRLWVSLAICRVLKRMSG